MEPIQGPSVHTEMEGRILATTLPDERPDALFAWSSTAYRTDFEVRGSPLSSFSCHQACSFYTLRAQVTAIARRIKFNQ